MLDFYNGKMYHVFVYRYKYKHMKMRTVKTEKITFSKGGSYLSWLVIQTILLFDKGGKGDGGES
jgi:hypothetical protein